MNSYKILPPAAPQDYFSKRLVVGYKNADQLPFPQEPFDVKLAEFCAAASKPSWDLQDKTSSISAHQSLTAKRLLCGPPSTTRGRVGLPALIATRANPWYVRISAKPTGITVGLMAEAASTW
jgi:hypothetical protein